MNDTLYTALCVLLPLLGTTLGAAMVFLMKNKIGSKVEKVLLGFASGVMIAASVWSLIIPAIEMSENLGKLSFVPAVVGFLGGIFFLLLIDKVVPHFHVQADRPEGRTAKLKKTTMMVFAVTIHNIPEGMAIGVVIAGAIAGVNISFQAALVLAIGIAIQNFPEGAIISMPLNAEGVGKPKSFLYGFLSGIVEPIAALLTILLVSGISVILPYLLAFAAGAMIYVVADELIPESQNGDHTHLGIIGLAFGFAVMMCLDVALG